MTFLLPSFRLKAPTGGHRGWEQTHRITGKGAAKKISSPTSLPRGISSPQAIPQIFIQLVLKHLQGWELNPLPVPPGLSLPLSLQLISLPLTDTGFVAVLCLNDEQFIPNLTQTLKARQELDLALNWACTAWPGPTAGVAQQGCPISVPKLSSGTTGS